MNNTGIVYDSTEKTPVTLPEFAELLPPLTGEQLAALEADIMENGCYSPLIVNEDLEIVDGHTRRKLCEKHGIPYNMVVFHFENRLDAMHWALETQKGRRNLSNWELGKIALKLKPMLRAKGRANQSVAGGNKKSQNAREQAITITPVDTCKEMADSVGIGRDVMNKIIQIDEKAPQAVKDALDRREISVNRGYQITRQVQELPEEERQQAAESALEDGQQKKALRNSDAKPDAETDRRAEIAGQFTKAMRKDFDVQPTEENVRCWVEQSGMGAQEIQKAISKAHELAGIYTSMEWTLRILYPQTNVQEQKRGQTW